MASSHQGGSASSANAPPHSRQEDSSDSETNHVTTANAVQDQTTDATQAQPPNTTTSLAPPAPAPPQAQIPTAPAPPAHHRGLRGARWFMDEIMFVFTLLAEEPTMPWREITPRFNRHFRNRPIRVGGRLEPRAHRSSQAVRHHFRQLRRPLQDRLDAQRGVGDHLVEGSEAEGGRDEDDEEEVQQLGQILLDAVEGIKSRQEDSDDEGPGGDDDLPGGGAPIAV
ncbi:hypothetical protein PRZ48_004919 [Zasmidium cellare]|uniref:Myb-like domain-containing protein n=1 Tax=Zasmidium cellare TaxID=395010 RepID=A0ABR0EQY4_ZASCE|nr:hypothetical protein PRZ48_004919 [Zasmidium cellare]